MSLFSELRRRNVIRLAGLYLVSAWLIVQVAETLLPIFETPAWVLKLLVVLLVLGFLPAVILAWVFELTPEGLRRDQGVGHAPTAIDHTARRLDMAVIALLLLVGGTVLVDSVRSGQDGATGLATGAVIPPTAAIPAESMPASAADAKTIAVPPFADFSAEGDQAWFSDGLTEEILN